MDDLVSRALDLAEVRGAGYADIRIVRTGAPHGGAQGHANVAVDVSPAVKCNRPCPNHDSVAGTPLPAGEGPGVRARQ